MSKITIKSVYNGPFRLSIDTEDDTINNVLFGANGKSIAVKKNSILCRCGKSNKQPYCDGVHRMSGFSSSDTFEAEIKSATVVKKGPLKIESEENLSNKNLCRCGASENMPFCDDIHTSLTSRKYTF